MSDAEKNLWWCPWCEAVIVVDGELYLTPADVYWHAYEHQDKGPYAVEITEVFERLETTETNVSRINQ